MNSIVVIELNNILREGIILFDKTDIAILAICKFLFDTKMGMEKVKEFSIQMGEKDKFKEEFRKKRVQYINFFIKIEEGLNEQLYNILDIQKRNIKELWDKLNRYEMQLTNKKEDILSSLIHMYCNRLLGTNREKEIFVRNLAAKTIHSLISYKNHNKLKIKQ